MTTQLPHQSNNGIPVEKQVPDPTASILPDENEMLYPLDDPDDDAIDPFGMHHPAPFQVSQPMPQVSHPQFKPLFQVPSQSGQFPPFSAPTEQKQPRLQPQRRKMPLLLIASVATVAVVVIITTVMTAFAAAPSNVSTTTIPQQQKHQLLPPQQQKHQLPPPPKRKVMPVARPTMVPQQQPPQLPQPQQPPTWVDQTLPDGWQNAGLTKADAIEAGRTALAFTDREMELDFRNIGTRGEHGGTFTAAVFILTPAAKARFAQNDIRVINNTLFDRVFSQKMIQAAVDTMPKITKFQQGKQQLAWADVSFHLWQSQVDPKNGQQRIEGLDLDPATKQPRMHHMSVLLLRAAPEQQGPGAPMGGTGWLVSNYGLDLQGLLDIVQPA